VGLQPISTERVGDWGSGGLGEAERGKVFFVGKKHSGNVH